MGQEHHTHEFVATYTRKDAILYALAIGFGSNEATYEQDLPYVYEHHEDFSIVPSFNTALFFSARQPNEMNSVLPTFPPAIMKSMGILPRNHLREKVLGFDSLPVLHIMQRITWHDERGELLTPPNHHTPASVNLHSSFRSITPKEIGTYVVLSTQLFQEDHSVCEVESTSLVLGLDPAVVTSACSLLRLQLGEVLPRVTARRAKHSRRQTADHTQMVMRVKIDTLCRDPHTKIESIDWRIR